MAVEMVHVDGVDLCVETFGERGAPPVLLIAGAAESMEGWDPDLCRLLAGEGRFVVRYDHRDTGRSTSWPPGAPGYTGRDLVADAAELIDLLAGGRAHLVGLSMGGAIAQHLAVEHPERVATLTLISTTPGPADDLPPVSQRLRAALAAAAPDPDWSDADAVVERIVEGYRPYAGPGCFDESAVREMARRVVARTPNRGASAGNHWLLEDAGDVRPRLGQVRAPALVVHGSEDPLFPPGHGEALAREIPGAGLLLLEGMGHQAPPRSTWDVVVPAILRHTDHRVRFARVVDAEARAHDERFRIPRVAIEEARRLGAAEGLDNVAALSADEVLDVYDDNMRRIGSESRAVVHREGLWHRSFHCWIAAERGGCRTLLFQLRGPCKQVFPNLLDITAAGHLTAGEQPEDGVRELEEELGVRVDDRALRDLGVRCDVAIAGDVVNREFCHTYLLRDDRRLDEYRLQEDEVAGLVEMDLEDGLRLFSGEVEAIEVSSVTNVAGTGLARRTVRVTDVVPRTDRYYLKALIMAGRLLDGERHLAI